MTIKEIDSEEIKVLKIWSEKKHGFTILPQELLPKGLIAYKDDKPVIAGFRYVSDDRLMMFVAYVIANPDADNLERSACFNELMNSFNDEAKCLGVKILFTSANCGSLTNRCRKFGFTECDTDVVHLVKAVN